MKNLKFLLLTLFAFALLNSELRASHLLGSQITYTCIGPNQYRVRLTVYRDCAGISAESSQTLRYSSAQCNVNTTITLSRVQAPVDITPLCPTQASRCGGNGPYGIQEVVYEGTINLPPGCGNDWVLSWNLCCRNDAINNLGSPGNQDMGVTARLDNTIQPLCNNSPQFNNVPAAILCINQPFVYNHGVTDPDGDSLFFSLGNCLQNPNSQVNYSGGFNGVNPLPTVSGVTINPSTGAISFTPNQIFVGVICIKVEEFRNGVKIGEINRDMQFRVINCSNVPPVASGINGSPNNDPVNFEISSCTNSQLCFDIDFTDANNNNINVTWNAEIVGATFTVAGNNTTAPVATFCWTPSNNDLGLNVFSVNVRDDACPVIGTGTYTFSVNVVPSPNVLNAGADQTICSGQSATLTATSSPAALSYTWTPVGTLNTSNGATVVATPLTTTSYEVFATFPDGCDLTDVVTVFVAPDPVISINPLNPFNCANQNNVITATATNAATYLWSPGGFNTPTINVAPSATTTYTVTVTSPQGCVSQSSTTVNIAAPAGNVCNVLYVTPTGSPTATGTRNDPMDLQTAMTVGACNGTVIKMAIGNYVTDTTINRVTSYLTLEGGFDNNVNWEKVSTAGATRILRTATQTTSTLNGTGITDENGLDPRVIAIEVSGQTGFRFQDLTVEVVSLAGGSPIIGYRGVTTKGIQINNSSEYNIVRTNVVVGGASNGSNSWCVAAATQGGSSFGIDITGNGPGASILSSSVSAGAAGNGGAACAPGFPTAGANGTSQSVRIAGTPLAANEASFNLAGQATIRMDDIACTATPIGFSSGSSNNWTFGAGSAPANATGASVSSSYSSLGRKNISFAGSNYVGFANIILDDQVLPAFTTSAPFVQGQFRVCVGEPVSFQATNAGVGYTLIWTDGTNTLSGVGQQFESFITSFSTPGIFQIQLNYETGCCGLSQPALLTLHVEAQPLAVITEDQEICFGTGVGTELTISGGVTGGTISWTPSTGLNSNNTETVIAIPSSTTTYEVQLSDSTGLCVDYASVTVSVINLNVTTVVVDATCGPDGSATANVTGGSGNYSYLWSNGQVTQTASNLQVGTYTVLVTDNLNGCQDSAFAVVNPSGGALVGFISNSTDVTCAGSNDGTITVTVVGGQAPFTYDWGPQGSSTSALNSNTISGLAGGNYEVTVTDDLGCTYNVTGNVFEPSQVLFDVDSLFDPTCNGTNNGFIRVTTDGGVSPYTYSWTQIPGNNTNVASGLPEGAYTLLATDFNGCTDSITLTLTAPPIPLTVIDSVVCEGTAINISPLQPFTASVDTIVNETVLVNGCFEAYTLNLTVIPLPFVTISGTATICEGQNSDITLNGTPNATVTYNINGGLNQTVTLNASGTATLNTGAISSNATYNLVSIQTNTSPNCTQSLSESVTVTVVLLPTASISGTTTICEGENTDITFAGTPNTVVTYNINGGGALTVTLDASGNATVNTGNLSTQTTYNLVSVSTQGTPACSQTVTGSAVVSIVNLPTATISGTTTICSGESTNVTFAGTPNAVVTYNANGVVQTVTLNASGNATVSTGAISSSVTWDLVSVATSGTPVCNNSVSGSITVTVLDLPSATIAATSSIVCEGGSTTITFTGTPGAVVIYNVDGGNNQQITLNAQGTATVNTGSLSNATTYNLVSVNLDGTPACLQIVNESVTIDIIDLPFAEISGDTIICTGNDAFVVFEGTPNSEVTFTVNGSDIQTIILDNDGQAIFTTDVLEETTTFELVSILLLNTDCEQTLTGDVTVTVVPLPQPTITATPDTIIRDDNSVLEVTGGDSFVWSPVQSTESVVTVSPEEDTEYFVVVTDNFGCEAEVSIVVYVLPRAVTIAMPDAFTPNGDGINDVFELFNKADFDDITMRVYNRWGEMVHEGRGQTHGWDGNYKGKAQDQDIYIYYIEASSSVTGQSYKITSSFSLLR